MSHPTRQQYKNEKDIDYLKFISQEKLIESQPLLNHYRLMISGVNAMTDTTINCDMNGDIFNNVSTINVLAVCRAEYVLMLCVMRFYTNILSNTLTEAQYSATQEKMTDFIELKFEVFGMKHQEKWGKAMINHFENYKKIYELYKRLHNIN